MNDPDNQQRLLLTPTKSDPNNKGNDDDYDSTSSTFRSFPGTSKVYHTTGGGSNGRRDFKTTMIETLMSPVYAVFRPTQRLPSQYDNKVLVYLDNYFAITSNRSDFTTEILGGITNFLCTAYILSLQPALMAMVGMDPNGVFLSTVLISCFGTLAMGLVGGVPLIVAPAMADNAFFVYVLVQTYGIPWRTCLGLGLIVSSIEFLVVFFGLRAPLIKAVYEEFRLGLAIGIGLFLGLLGMRSAGLIVVQPNTTFSFAFNNVAGISWTVGVSLLCLIFMMGLIIRRHRFALIIPMLLTAIAIIIGKWIEGSLTPLDSFGQWNTSTIFQLSFDFQSLQLLWLAPVMVLAHILDSSSTILTSLRNLYFDYAPISFRNSANSQQKIEATFRVSSKVRRILLIDIFFGIISAILGNSVSITFIESCSGIAVGARTGFAAVISALLFLFSLLLKPLVPYVAPAEATGPALILTSALLLTFLKNLDWNKDQSKLLPGLVVMFAIPYTYSFADGAAIGYLMHFSWLIGGRYKKITLPMAILLSLCVFHIGAKLFILL